MSLKRETLLDIFAGICMVSGLIFKGINTFINYKKANLMADGKDIPDK